MSHSYHMVEWNLGPQQNKEAIPWKRSPGFRKAHTKNWGSPAPHHQMPFLLPNPKGPLPPTPPFLGSVAGGSASNLFFASWEWNLPIPGRESKGQPSLPAPWASQMAMPQGKALHRSAHLGLRPTAGQRPLEGARGRKAPVPRLPRSWLSRLLPSPSRPPAPAMLPATDALLKEKRGKKNPLN